MPCELESNQEEIQELLALFLTTQEIVRCCHYCYNQHYFLFFDMVVSK
jgi:hypothetical protein